MICEYCKTTASYQFKNGTFCCSKSVSGCPEIQKRKRETCKIKYGDENFKNTAKNKATKKERYGDENFNNREKASNTTIEKYGVNNVSKVDKIKLKKDATYDKNYRQNKTAHEQLIKKKQETWKNKDVQLVNNKRKQTCLEKYKVENPLQDINIKHKAMESYKNTIAKRTPEESRVIGQRCRANRVKNGTAIPEEQVPAFELYKNKVWAETNRNNLTLLENYEKRGRTDYHLDHMYSITRGFKNNVPPEIIGHICNLTMLPHKENRSKYIKCSITLKELEQKIKGHNV